MCHSQLRAAQALHQLVHHQVGRGTIGHTALDLQHQTGRVLACRRHGQAGDGAFRHVDRLHLERIQSVELDQLEAFASLNGPAYYGLPANEDTITLVRRDETVEFPKSVYSSDGTITVFDPMFPLHWAVEKQPVG